jgi:hypothetical protein
MEIPYSLIGSGVIEGLLSFRLRESSIQAAAFDGSLNGMRIGRGDQKIVSPDSCMRTSSIAVIPDSRS